MGAKRPWYISCSDILPHKNMKVVFIIISSLILVFNIICIILNLATWKSNKAFSLIVININFSEMTCGIYMCFILVSNKVLEGIFFVKEEMWRSGPVCFTAFSTILWFTIISQSLLVFLSLSRLMIVAHPLDTEFKCHWFVCRRLLVTHICTLITVLFITLFTRFVYFNIPLSICLPFVDPSGSVLIIKILTWSVVLTQTVTSIVIIILHVLLVVRLKSSKFDGRTNQSNDNSDVPLIVQLIMITVSNILCWFPANTIYVTTMFLSNYPTDLIIWTTVIGLPLNSIINPSVFIITSVRKYIKSKGN